MNNNKINNQKLSAPFLKLSEMLQKYLIELVRLWLNKQFSVYTKVYIKRKKYFNK